MTEIKMCKIIGIKFTSRGKCLFPFSLSLFGLSGNCSHLLEISLKGTLRGTADLFQVAARVTTRFQGIPNGSLSMSAGYHVLN